MYSLHFHHDTHGQDLARCIEACTECHAICEHMIHQHCLQRGGRHVAPAHLTLMADCAEICRVSAGFMLRGSPRHLLTCQACAEICEACAKDCEEVGDMHDCVQACRRCAEECQAMVAAHSS